MAHHKSAIKRIKTNLKRRSRNRTRESVIRGLVKKLSKLEGDAAVQVSRDLCAAVDKLARKGVIHKNKAGHIKSAAQKKISSASKK